MKKKYLIMTGDKILEETTNKQKAKKIVNNYWVHPLFGLNEELHYKQTPFGLFPDLYIKEVQND